MIYKKDPSKTITIRRAAVSRLNARFNRIKKGIPTAVRSTGFAYQYDAQKINAFMAWLRREINTEVLAYQFGQPIRPRDHFLNAFVGDVYRRGVKSSRTALARQLIKQGLLPETSVFANPAHVQRAELIFTRVYSQLQGITATMEGQMTRVLADGIIQGYNPNKVAKLLTERVDAIGKVRATRLARTEIINAHGTAAIKEAEELGELLGEEIKMKWRTAMDGRERPQHAAWNEKIMDMAVAQSRLGAPNCRCSVSPMTETMIELEKEKKRRKTRDAAIRKVKKK